MKIYQSTREQEAYNDGFKDGVWWENKKARRVELILAATMLSITLLLIVHYFL